ncbi:MAG: hypothetical protein AB4062_03470 [Crocosphaera sp.]
MIILLFFPASLGLVWTIFFQPTWSEKVLAFALFLMSLEQARMAKVDLDNIRIVQEKSKEVDKVKTFLGITIITIIVELLGFYWASFFLYWGAIIVLISLIFFNIFAKIKLHPTEEIMIEPCQISQRLPILLADGLAIILINLGKIDFFPLLMSSVLLGIIVIYGIIKYSIYI